VHRLLAGEPFELQLADQLGPRERRVLQVTLGREHRLGEPIGVLRVHPVRRILRGEPLELELVNQPGSGERRVPQVGGSGLAGVRLTDGLTGAAVRIGVDDIDGIGGLLAGR